MQRYEKDTDSQTLLHDMIHHEEEEKDHEDESNNGNSNSKSKAKGRGRGGRGRGGRGRGRGRGGILASNATRITHRNIQRAETMDNQNIP